MVELFLLWLLLFEHKRPPLLELVVKLWLLTSHLNQLLEVELFIGVDLYVELGDKFFKFLLPHSCQFVLLGLLFQSE